MTKDSPTDLSRLASWSMRQATTWAHVCGACGAGAMHGYTDRSGVTRWFCPAHREAGEAVLPTCVQAR